jgi:hypothetical protein
MCQYILKIFDRLPDSDGLSRIQSGETKLDVAVPKFHLAAHVGECRSDMALNNIPGAGRVDGEEPERSWAISNKAASSTVDMGPGARKDTLNGFFGMANWRRTVCFGELAPGRCLVSNLMVNSNDTARQDSWCNFADGSTKTSVGD